MEMSTLMGRREDAGYHDGLDQILSNTEFETSQQEQQIQIELDKIKAHEKEIEEKEREMVEFERLTADVEARREKASNQLQINRDNISSLKHTATVVDEHIEALGKQYQSLVRKNSDTQSQYESAVEKYACKWECFEDTYSNMPRARELSDKRETLNQIKGEEAALDAEMAELQDTIDSMKPEGPTAVVRWVLNIATVKVETEAISCLIHSTRQAVLQTQQQLSKKKPTDQGREESMVIETGGEMEGEGVESLSESGCSNTTLMDTSSELDHNEPPHTSPLQQVPSLTDDGSPTGHQTGPQGTNIAGGTTHRVGEPNDPISQGSGVFMKPQAPPRRFVMKQTPHLPHPKGNNMPINPGATPSFTAPSVTPSSVGKHLSAPARPSVRPSTIPPAYKRYSIKLPPPPPSPHHQHTLTPVPPSPRHYQHTVTSHQHTLPPPPSPVVGRTFQIPKFSLPLPTGATNRPSSSSASSSVHHARPTQSTGSNTLTRPTQTAEIPKSNKHTPSSSSSSLRSGAVIRPQYRLLMPPKPASVPVRAPLTPSTLVTEPPPPPPVRLFSLTHHSTSTTNKQQQQQQQAVLPTTTQVSSTNPTPVPVKTFPKYSISKLPSVSRELPSAPTVSVQQQSSVRVQQQPNASVQQLPSVSVQQNPTVRVQQQQLPSVNIQQRRVGSSVHRTTQSSYAAQEIDSIADETHSNIGETQSQGSVGELSEMGDMEVVEGDQVMVGGGDQVMVGGGGGDQVMVGGGEGDQVMVGGGDQVMVGGGDQVMVGGGEGDQVMVGGGDQVMVGGREGDQVMVGGGEGDQVMVGGGEGEASFNYTGTSIDFGEESVDYEGGGVGGLFGLQQEDANTFTMSNTESFFNTTNQQSGGGYNFMTLNEGGNPSSSSSDCNIHDFFSQFGKTDTPAENGAGGGFLF